MSKKCVITKVSNHSHSVSPNYGHNCMHFNAIIRKNSQKYLRGRGSVEQKFAVACVGQTGSINLLAPELFFFLNLAHSVYKM